MGSIKKYKKLYYNIMKIFLVGDIGAYNNITKKIFKNIKETQDTDDTLLILGDNFYPYGINSDDDKNWNHYINLNNKLKTYCILGNHDYLGNVKSQINYKLNNWYMEGHYYKKTIEKYDIFFLDTSILVPNYSNLNYNIVKSKINKEPLNESLVILNWLSEELEKSNNYKIVVGHYPIVSFGMYGLNKTLFEILFPIFKQYDVKCYISGHDHNLQIIDIETKDYSFKQIVSGASSSIYPILKNVSEKVFSENGYIYIDTYDNTINIMNIDNKMIYQDKLL
jgi:tartrate-resistant acid phosphatase type 5